MSSRKWNTKTVEKFIEENTNYTFIKYDYILKGKRKRHWVWLTCPNGHKYDCNFDNFKRGICGCSECANNKRTQIEDILKILNNLNYKLERIKYDEENKLNNHSKVIIICDKGHKYETSIECLKMGCTCSICKGNKKHEYEYVKNYIEGFGDKLLTKAYKNDRQNLKIQCPKGHIYYKNFNKYKNANQRCVYCNMSSGEQEIARILDKYNIKYEIQYKFKDCKNVFPLPFDFYIDNKLRPIIIEFDGYQHFHLKSFNDTFNDFIKRKINDGIKNEYCLNKGINLIRIPYWNFNYIEEIICQLFKINNE